MTFLRHNDDRSATVVPPWVATGIALLLLAGAADVLRAALGVPHFAEDGPLEMASAAGYLLALAVLASRAAHRVAAWPVAVLLIAAAARELDFDKRFTEPGILQSRLYTGDAALGLKLAGLAAVTAVLAAAAVLCRRHGADWLRGLAAGAAGAWWLAGALALALVSKSLDGLGRKLRPLGVEVPAGLDRAASLAEEALELGIPVAVVLAMVAGLPATGRAR